MTVANTVKKLEKLTGLTVQTNENNEHWVIYKGYIISFYPNGHFTPESEATCFYTKRTDLKDDTQSDYFAGCFHDNITQCVKHVERMTKDSNIVYYIEYLNKDKNFAKDVIEFGSDNDAAIIWGRNNLENFNMDMVKIKFTK